MPLKRYVIGLSLMLALSALWLSFAGPLVAVFVGLLFVRLFGQGLMIHASMTSMSRYFADNRGLAIAFAGLGIPLGQAVFPIVGVKLMALYGWQTSWGILALSFIALGLPFILYLLKGFDVRHQQWLQSEQEKADESSKANEGVLVLEARRSDVLRDLRFYLMLPALLSLPFWITAVFFFAETLAVEKGITLETFTAYYPANALGAVTLPFLAGVFSRPYWRCAPVARLCTSFSDRAAFCVLCTHAF